MSMVNWMDRVRARVAGSLKAGPATGGLLAGVLVGLGSLGAAAVPAALLGVTAGEARAEALVAGVAEAAELDKLVFRNGNVVEGEIISVTATEIRFMVVKGSLRAPATYSRAEVLQIVEAADRPAEDADEIEAAEASPADDGDAADEPLLSADASAPRVAKITLKGEFGRDFTPTPIRDAVEAVRRDKPDYLIVHLDNLYSSEFGGEFADDTIDPNALSLFGMADEIERIFYEVKEVWEHQPKVVFWVRNAMGGSAFLPWLGDEIYMHEEGRIGGIGYLEAMFQGVGDASAQEKQRSLRLGRWQGMLIAGGWDYRLITALTKRSYVLSYSLSERDFVERMPESADEILLTDDGKGENVDNVQQRINGTGNDALTLKHETAKLIGVSSGTANDLDEVLEGLGILRNHIMLGDRGDRILERWSDDVKRAQRRDLPDLWEEYERVANNGNTPDDRRRAILRRINILRDIKNVYRRFGEGLDPASAGVPAMNQIDIMIAEQEIALKLIP